jgi:hypothetical protein
VYTRKLTAIDAADLAEALTGIKMQIEDLLQQARGELEGTGLIARRAESYWLAHLQGCLDDRGCMVTMQDTIDELNDPENFESDAEAE